MAADVIMFPGIHRSKMIEMPPPAIAPATPGPSGDLIKTIEDLLERVKSGEVVAIAYAGLTCLGEPVRGIDSPDDGMTQSLLTAAISDLSFMIYQERLEGYSDRGELDRG